VDTEIRTPDARDEESLAVFTCLSSRPGVTDRVPGPLPVSSIGDISETTGQYALDPGNREMLDWRG